MWLARKVAAAAGAAARRRAAACRQAAGRRAARVLRPALAGARAAGSASRPVVSTSKRQQA